MRNEIYFKCHMTIHGKILTLFSSQEPKEKKTIDHETTVDSA